MLHRCNLLSLQLIRSLTYPYGLFGLMLLVQRNSSLAHFFRSSRHSQPGFEADRPRHCLSIPSSPGTMLVTYIEFFRPLSFIWNKTCFVQIK